MNIYVVLYHYLFFNIDLVKVELLECFDILDYFDALATIFYSYCLALAFWAFLIDLCSEVTLQNLHQVQQHIITIASVTNKIE